MYVRRLSSKNKNEFELLMRESHQQIYNFYVDPSFLKWNPLDEENLTLGIYFNNELVSCMRSDLILNSQDLALRLKLNSQHPAIHCPAVYLTKAGTLTRYRKFGLNTILRYICILLAQKLKVNYMYGIMVPGSPRIYSMKMMGYDFFESQDSWDDNCLSDDKPLVARLDLNKNASVARSWIESNYKKNLSTIKNIDDFLQQELKHFSEKITKSNSIKNQNHWGLNT